MPVLRVVLSAHPVVVVEEDIPRLVGDLECLLHQTVIARGAVGTVEVEGGADIGAVVFGLGSDHLPDMTVDGVKTLTDIGFAVLVDAGIDGGDSR